MTVQIPEAYNIFLDRLVTEVHGADISDSIKQDIKQDLYLRLLSHLTVSLNSAIPDEHARAFDELMQSSPDEAQVASFYFSHIPNYKEIAKQSLEEFYKTYKNS